MRYEHSHTKKGLLVWRLIRLIPYLGKGLNWQKAPTVRANAFQ
jgi:hypothetical protein